jgi:hypothetical protein
LNKPREFYDELKQSVKASLESAGFSANYQSSQKWLASFNVSNISTSGGVSFFFDRVCVHCGETIPYRVINSQGAFGGRVNIPLDAAPATIAELLVREAAHLFTNRLPAATHHNPGVGAGLLSPQAAGQLSEELKAHGGGH